eukprot:64579_1
MAYNDTSRGYGAPVSQTTPQTRQQPQQPYNNNNNAGDWDRASAYSGSQVDSYPFRITALLTVLLVYAVFNLIPYAIADHDNGPTSYKFQLSGFCVITAGVAIPFLRYFFSTNAA